MNNEVWREESEDIPVYVSYRTDEGIVVRIKDRRTEFSSWKKFTQRIHRVMNDQTVHSYEDMSEESQQVFDYLSEVVDIHKERMEVVENV